MGGGRGCGNSRVTAGPVTESYVAAGAVAEKKMESGGAVTLDGYGENVFRGAVAEPYLKENGLKLAELESGSWVKSPDKADQMAKAVLGWATDRGASSFCHWFQPCAATYRHGQTGQVQLAMFEFDKTGKPIWDFKGKDLLRGETDGSSYPNGGLRATHTAGGYLTIDPESPIFLRGDAIFVPACFVSFKGYSLDEKLPLKRAVQAMSKQGARLFKLMNFNVEGMVNNIGLEQELFLIPRDAYYKRPDLQMTGRTVMGKLPGRGQEGCDHYMAPIHTLGPAMACMKEIQEECYKLGIPLKTRHREVAPNQYEFAPLFGSVVTQTDQNLVVMQIMEEVANKHGLAALLIEKPFAGVNGSGKHNNWSISTKCGAQLYNPGDLTKKSGNSELFPVVMAATVSAIDKFGDLMRMAIASPGNDFRLGAMEAPPAVLSTYLGEQMTKYLEEFMSGDVKEYVPKTTVIPLGVEDLPTIEVPAEDRNRTSPFPYGGHRFEFRAVGSSQNVSLVNTVLNAMMAKQFAAISDRVEAGETPVGVAQDLLKQHFKCVYNGNGYDPAWPDTAVEKGVTRIDSGVDAIDTLKLDKNVDLFTSMGIFTADEVDGRRCILLELYVGVVEMEALTMIDMMNQHVIPSAKAAGMDLAALQAAVKAVQDGIAAVHAGSDESDKAAKARVLRLETMIAARKVCDETEALCPASLWTLATYQQLFFMDMNENLNTVYKAP